MDNENITKPAMIKAEKIIEARLNGLNKQQSRLEAGYSVSTSKTNIPEKTKAYQFVLAKTLEENTQMLYDIGTIIRETIDSGEVDKLNPTQKIDFYNKMAQIHKILTPQVTIKEEMMKDGSTKRTTWGQGSVAS